LLFGYCWVNLPDNGNPASPASSQLMSITCNIVAGIWQNHNKALVNSKPYLVSSYNTYYNNSFVHARVLLICLYIITLKNDVLFKRSRICRVNKLRMLRVYIIIIITFVEVLFGLNSDKLKFHTVQKILCNMSFRGTPYIILLMYILSRTKLRHRNPGEIAKCIYSENTRF